MGSAGDGGLGHLRRPQRAPARPAKSTKRQRLGSIASVVEPSVEAPVLDTKRFLFCEFFAGVGALTSAVSTAGVPVRPPEDLAVGGIDFSDKSAVDALRREFEELAASGVRCMIHFAPPCSTFRAPAIGRAGRVSGLPSSHKAFLGGPPTPAQLISWRGTPST